MLTMLVKEKSWNAFHPERGIRQGEPISPYILLYVRNICVSIVIHVNIESSEIGIKITKGSPTISYLMFADNCLIFLKSNKTDSKRG